MSEGRLFGCPRCGKTAKLEVSDILHMTVDPLTGAIGMRARPVSDDCLYTGGDFNLWCPSCGQGWHVTIDHKSRRIAEIGDEFN